ncbi:MAG: Hsp70 family protein [Clostridia bacterium]|nr:Hsp70 family protein [Clostridia bacterium]
MYIGVDFGTSFSQTSVFHNGQPLPLLSGGMYGIQSVFYYDSIEGAIIGEEAKSSAQGINAGNIVRDVKMKIGKQFTLDSKDFTAEEIIRAIYKEVLTLAEVNGSTSIDGFKIDGMVISHPAKFSMTEINTLTRAAGACLGKNMNIIGTIKEPVAAALSYYYEKSYKPKNGSGVLVYDLGGGTCDVALVCADCCEDAEYKVIDSDMVRIGGRDWDRLICDYVIEKIEQLTGNYTDVRGKISNLNTINDAVIAAKHRLSRRAETTVRVNLELNGEIKNIELPISRALFEEITVELLDETVNKLEDVYYRNISNIDIEEIICVGGSSNMTQVREALEERFGDCEVRVYMPEYAVVNGSAIYAHKVMEKMKELGYDTENNGASQSLVQKSSQDGIIQPPKKITSILLTEHTKMSVLTDMLPFSYGIRCKKSLASNEYLVKNLLKRGSEIPVSGAFMDFAPKGEATAVKIDICESECTDDTYLCDIGMNERIIGSIILETPDGITAKDSITCKLTISSLDIIDVEVYDNRGNKIAAQVMLNNDAVV